MTKSLLFTLALALTLGKAYAQEDYVQFEIIHLKPDTKNLATLTKNMKAHNDEYHSAVPYYADVWRIATGPQSGWIAWVMGPGTFAHQDNRPTDDGHGEDWTGNILPYVKEVGTTEFWRLDDEHSSSLGASPSNIYIRYYKVNNEMGFLLGDVIDKMSETRKAMPEGRPWFWYNNMFQQGDIGRHFASITPFDKWSELDNGMDLDPSSPGTFRSTFENKYGASAWTPFNSSLQEVFSDSYTEIWSIIPGMSAPPIEN